MDIKKPLILILLTIISGASVAQQPALHYEFEPSSNTLIKRDTPKEEAKYIIDLQQPQYAIGISGQCLDLSADAILRMPMNLDVLQVP